jgi:hypothetical protein
MSHAPTGRVRTRACYTGVHAGSDTTQDVCDAHTTPHLERAWTGGSAACDGVVARFKLRAIGIGKHITPAMEVLQVAHLDGRRVCMRMELTLRCPVQGSLGLGIRLQGAGCLLDSAVSRLSERLGMRVMVFSLQLSLH